MVTRGTYSTPWPDVNELIDQLKFEIQSMYLHGSLAIGNFDPQRSDVDFVVVTDGELPDVCVSAQKSMHARTADSDLKWKITSRVHTFQVAHSVVMIRPTVHIR